MKLLSELHCLAHQHQRGHFPCTLKRMTKGEYPNKTVHTAIASYVQEQLFDLEVLVIVQRDNVTNGTVVYVVFLIIFH